MNAGLPNIAAFGEFGDGLEITHYSGAFYQAGPGSHATAAGNGKPYNLGFDASRCSTIYGRSTTVTPASQSVLWCMKY